MSARQIMSADEIRRALVRIGHEIVERQGGAHDLALVGIEHRGPILAQRIADEIAGARAGHGPRRRPRRDALSRRPRRAHRRGRRGRHPDRRGEPFDPARTTVVLVDDILYTGRTVRAALDALVDLGRPAAVRLAVLVDRGHRELPIRADHVGRNVPTARDERVQLHLAEVDGTDEVLLLRDGE